MKIKKTCCLLLVLVLFLISSPVNAISIDTSLEDMRIDHYEYPITLDSPDWFKYSVLEKVEMLKIPDDILSRMTDEALVQAVVDYPYIGDIYYYGNGKSDGVHTVTKYCSALNELLTRDSGIGTLKSYGQEIIQNKLSAYSLTSDYRDRFEAQVLSDIINVLDTNVKAFELPSLAAASGPVTPKGTALSTSAYLIRTELHSDASHIDADQNAIDTHGVTLVRRGSCIYNCHSYAWHSRSASNPY